jgi:hypothetical protein
MHQKLLYCRDEFSLLAGTFRLAVWVVIQATFPAGSRSYFQLRSAGTICG